MANPYNNMTDGQLASWYANFVDVATTNALPLGLDAAETTALSDAETAFDNARTARDNAFAAAKSSTIAKNDARATVLALVGQYNNEWQANPAISPTLLQQLGLSPHASSRSTVPVFEPTNFTASGKGNGAVTLKWSRNGNVYGCTFFIEVSYDEGVTWQVYTATPKQRITLQGVPMVPTTFRVRGERNGVFGEPSSTANVYFPAGESTPPSEELPAAA